MRKIIYLGSAALAFGFGICNLVQPAQATTIIYQDNFGGIGTLNGSTPAPVDTGAATWLASTSTTVSTTPPGSDSYTTDGTELNTSTLTASNNNAATAYLPFTPQSGFVYTLTVTANLGATPANSTQFATLGFGSGADTGQTGNSYNGDSIAGADTGPWMLIRGTGAMKDVYNGDAATNGTFVQYDAQNTGTAGQSTQLINHTTMVATGIDTIIAGINTMSVVLDTTGTNWTASYYVDSQLIETHTYSSAGSLGTLSTNPDPTNISYVDLSNSSGAVANFTSFSLTSTPEPTSLGLFSAAVAGLVLRRRRALNAARDRTRPMLPFSPNRTRSAWSASSREVAPGPRRADPSSSRAFTLVELLVVIGIIAVLISIILPALSKASESARGIQCASNMRQIGTALEAYLQNNQEYFPLRSVYLQAGGTSGLTVYAWAGHAGSAGSIYSTTTAIDRPLNQYLGQYTAKSPVPIASCPSDDAFGTQSLYALFGSSYTYNNGLVDLTKPTTTTSPAGTAYYCSIRRSQVLRPTRMVVMQEGYASNFVLQQPGSYTTNLFYLHYGKGSATQGRWNLLFADGHVEAPSMQIYSTTPDNNGNASDLFSDGVVGFRWGVNAESADYSFVND